MNKDIFEENDRNIRVFGLETQKKLFESEVLIMNITPMMSELCKNLILSGAGICLYDDGSNISSIDSETNFFFNINDSGKKKVDILQQKIKTFKQTCRINIITTVNDIKNKKLKYAVMDLSDDSFNKDTKKEVENIIIENKGIIYYIKIENDKAVFVNNILEKKFLEENKDGKETLFVKDEKIIEHMDLSDDEGSDNENNKENKKDDEEKKDMKVVELTNNNEDEDEKEKELLKEDDYTFLDFEKKVEEIKKLIPKNMKKNEESVINDSFKVIYNKSECPRRNPLTCLSNYVIGGVVCHEIINCISKKKNPRTNIYYYDAFNGTGKFLNELYDKVLK